MLEQETLQTLADKIALLTEKVIISKVKLSCYTPWRHLGGEEVWLLLNHDLSTRWR
jgi:hypothetical protein